MDLVNELSSDVALALLVEGSLRKKLDGEDAKSLIALVETELRKMAQESGGSGRPKVPDILSH